MKKDTKTGNLATSIVSTLLEQNGLYRNPESSISHDEYLGALTDLKRFKDQHGLEIDLITGTTGSGKSVTANNLFRHDNDILTVVLSCDKFSVTRLDLDSGEKTKIDADTGEKRGWERQIISPQKILSALQILETEKVLQDKTTTRYVLEGYGANVFMDFVGVPSKQFTDIFDKVVVIDPTEDTIKERLKRPVFREEQSGHKLGDHKDPEKRAKEREWIMYDQVDFKRDALSNNSDLLSRSNVVRIETDDAKHTAQDIAYDINRLLLGDRYFTIQTGKLSNWANHLAKKQDYSHEDYLRLTRDMSNWMVKLAGSVDEQTYQQKVGVYIEQAQDLLSNKNASDAQLREFMESVGKIATR